MVGGEKAGLRERTRRAVRAELAELAMGLFLERGYEATTVEDIAAAVGMSKRSFFRYFAVKEDVLFGDVEEIADRIAAEIAARPEREDPWESLRAVLGTWEGRIHASQQELAGLRLVESTPVLRARLHYKRDELRGRVAEALRERPGSGLDAFTADLLVAAAGSALDAASREWLRSEGKADRAALVERAFALLSPASPGGSPPSGS
jgi:AcrR family transcriptional regulator